MTWKPDDALAAQAFELELELRITKGRLEEGMRSYVLRRARSWRHRKKVEARNLERVHAVAEELSREARAA